MFEFERDRDEGEPFAGRPDYPVYVFTDHRAIDLIEEAGAEHTSRNPLVRAVIDQDLGHICFGIAHPGDHVEEQVIKIETEDSERVCEKLQGLPGVRRVATSFYEALTL
jgi:hypothetical protein